MNASIKEFPTLSQRVSELDLPNLLDHASISNPRTEISIVLLSVDPKFLPNIDRLWKHIQKLFAYSGLEKGCSFMMNCLMIFGPEY